MPWRKGASATASAPHPYQVNIWNLESWRRQALGKSVIGLPAVGRPSLKVGSITTSVTDLILKRKKFFVSVSWPQTQCHQQSCHSQPWWPVTLLNHQTKQTFLPVSCYCQGSVTTWRRKQLMRFPAVTSDCGPYVGKEGGKGLERQGLQLWDSPQPDLTTTVEFQTESAQSGTFGVAAWWFSFVHISSNAEPLATRVGSKP